MRPYCKVNFHYKQRLDEKLVLNIECYVTAGFMYALICISAQLLPHPFIIVCILVYALKLAVIVDIILFPKHIYMHKIYYTELTVLVVMNI
jgi:hypothetical protein